MLEGHEACAKFLEKQVDRASRDTMLAKVEKVFTESDNQLLLSSPTKEEVREVLSASNLLVAPGTDGIPSLLTLYVGMCWVRHLLRWFNPSTWEAILQRA